MRYATLRGESRASASGISISLYQVGSTSLVCCVRAAAVEQSRRPLPGFPDSAARDNGVRPFKIRGEEGMSCALVAPRPYHSIFLAAAAPGKPRQGLPTYIGDRISNRYRGRPWREPHFVASKQVAKGLVGRWHANQCDCDAMPGDWGSATVHSLLAARESWHLGMAWHGMAVNICLWAGLAVGDLTDWAALACWR